MTYANFDALPDLVARKLISKRPHPRLPLEREIRGKYNVLFVVDDRDKVVRQWREMGLPCFQVAEGDF